MKKTIIKRFGEMRYGDKCIYFMPKVVVKTEDRFICSEDFDDRFVGRKICKAHGIVIMKMREDNPISAVKIRNFSRVQRGNSRRK